MCETDKQTVWSACCTAFFGSARMGELLAKSEASLDQTSDLVWEDIKIKPQHIIIHIKLPKCRTSEGEFIDLFSFEQNNYCPVQSILSHQAMQKEAGLWDSRGSVFRLGDGSNLTTTSLNRTLRELLREVVDYSKDAILCHSFRAGVASSLERFPNLASSEDIKGWGRWESAAFKKYARLKVDKRREIFEKISRAISS